MSTIYKVSRINKNKIISINVFLGKLDVDVFKLNILELQELFKKDPDNEVFKFVFNENEINKIKEENIDVYFSSEVLHNDDTIETIKKKIIKSLFEDISFESIYLFCKNEEILDPVATYQSLTQNGKIELTQDRYYQFLSNIGIETNITDIPDKEVYNYDDILNLDLANKKLIVNKPIGQHFVAVESTYPYTVNPFNALFYDPFLEKHANKLVTTSNKSLLLDSGLIYDNTIFLCIAHDVLEYAEEMELSQESTVNIYYPYLAELQITSLDEYIDNEQELIVNSKKLISPSFEKNVRNIDMFYTIYETKKNNLNYLSKGIKNIELTIHPNYTFILPLDLVFKLLHATRLSPLIKYNPGKRQEKIYRLYTEKTATNGKKIPYLNKALILRLSKAIGKTKRVSVYSDDEIAGDKLVSICEFEDNGDINITATFENAKEIDEATKRISEIVNPIISIISNYLEQSGYKLNNLSDLFDKNIEILDIEYVQSIGITNNINLNKYQGCVSSIFNIIEGDLRKGISLQYKRVSNFSEMESQEAFIVSLLNKGVLENDVINLLAQNFNITPEQAREKLAEYLSNLQLIQNTFQNRKIKIKNNPGFPTTIIKSKFTNDIDIVVKGINNAEYLFIIPIYLDSLIRITQNIDINAYSKQDIESLCKEQILDERDDETIEDIIAEPEKNIQERKEIEFEGEKLEFGEPDEEDNMLDILFADEEPDEADAEIEEGAEIELEGGAFGQTTKPAQTVSAVIGGPISEEDEEPDISLGSEIGSLSSVGTDDDIEIGQTIRSKTLPSEKTPDAPTPIEEEQPEISLGSEIGSLPSEKTIPSSVKTVSPIDKPLTPIQREVEIKEPIATTILDESLKEPAARITIKRPKLTLKKRQIEKEKEEETLKKDITGMNLTNPNPFFKRMETYDKPLFLTQQEGKFKAYSRICPWNVRRQPVILTPEEKEKIDKEHPGSYDKAIEYSTDPNKSFYYICPRYWSLTENTSLTEEEVKSGKYGDIIPRDAKKVPPGASIFEFDHTGADGKYQKLYPGFVKSGSHPNDFCLPCCFTTWDSPAQKKRRQECERRKVDKEEEVRPVAIEEEVKVTTADDYIKSVDKFPLDQNRWGYLPIILQKFLNVDNKKCQVSTTNTNLKLNTPCLLRHGVEVNKNQSFVAVIADLYTEFKPPNIPSINQMKEYIINATSLDNFALLNNGNLIQEFYNKDEVKDINIENYANTKTYKSLINKTENSNNLLKKIINSYENFIKFLRDPNSKIDHTYLWDIVCTPNEKLFPRGLNIALLDIPSDDITGNIRVLCPSNHYSSNLFDENKRTLLVFRSGSFYEPLYVLEDKKTNFLITRLFNLKNADLLPSLKDILEKIKLSINNFCKPLQSMVDIYKFKTNLPLVTVYKYLRNNNYNILFQILNYENKCIGVVAYSGDIAGFVPVYPSSPSLNIPTKLMDEEGIWLDYKTSLRFLNSLKEKSGGKILCAPKMKVIEDGLIVGILTETNQIVRLIKPEEDIYGDNLPILSEENTIENDIKSTIGEGQDKERIEYVKKIKSETGFFNAFRNTIRNLLNSYNNKVQREEIEKIIQAPYLTYSKKLVLITELIKSLTKDEVGFKEYTTEEIRNMPSIGTCNVKDVEQNCNLPYCSVVNNRCILQIPNINLINGLNNEEIYITRMADELIRYNRIKSFIFKPQSFLSFSEIGYNLLDNEIILLQSLLTQEYFEDLVPALSSEYVKQNTYDTAQPQTTQIYSDIAVLEGIKPQEEDEEKVIEEKIEDVKCENITPIEITSKWKSILPYKSIELEFPNIPDICTFECILTLIKDYLPNYKDMTKRELKERLAKLYETKYRDDLLGIYRILNEQGKKTLSKQLILGEVKLSDAIISDDYYATNIDFLVLAESFEIPLVFYSATKLIENGEPILILEKKNIFYYFVKSPGIRTDVKPTYRIAVSLNGSRIQALDMPEVLREMIDNSNVFSISEYIKAAAQKKKLKLVIKEPGEVIKKRKLRIREPPVEAPVEAPIIAISKPLKKRKLVIREPTKQEPIVTAQEILKEVAEELPAITEQAEVAATELPKQRITIKRKPRLVLKEPLESIMTKGAPTNLENIVEKNISAIKKPTVKRKLKIIEHPPEEESIIAAVELKPETVQVEPVIEEPERFTIKRKKLPTVKRTLKIVERPSQESIIPSVELKPAVAQVEQAIEEPERFTIKRKKIPIRRLTAKLIPDLNEPTFIAKTELVNKPKSKSKSPNKTRKSKSKSPKSPSPIKPQIIKKPTKKRKLIIKE